MTSAGPVMTPVTVTALPVLSLADTVPTVAGSPKSLPIFQETVQLPSEFTQSALPPTRGLCALAGAARTATPASPSTVPARTAVVRRNLVLSRFTPTPGLGSGVRRGGGGPTPGMGARPSTTPPHVVDTQP